MTTVQVKWLHCDGFRRFELDEPTYEALMEAIRKRTPTFHGGLCYTDAEEDKILINCDLDFADMVKYFRKKCAINGTEFVIKIQTNDRQNGTKNAGDSPAVTSSTSLARQKQKIEVIELLESADESNNAVVEIEQVEKNNGGIERTNTAPNAVDCLPPCDVRTASMNEFMREMVKIDEKHQIPQQKPFDLADQPGHSSWFVGPSEFDGNLSWSPDGAGPTTGVVHGFWPNGMADNATTSGQNLIEMVNRVWTKRKSTDRLVSCTQCGAGVTNENSSLKLHVNLHHLKLPIFSCKYCRKVEHKFSRANMIRHMQREHWERPETDFDHNSGKHRVELYAKIDECFPEAAAERKRRTANTDTEDK